MKKRSESLKEMGALRRFSRQKSDPSKRLFTIPELLNLAVLTRKQVSYWAKIKLLNPKLKETKARAGSPASFYSAEEVIKALIICDLKQAGFSLRQVQQVIRNLEEHGIRLDQAQNYLLTDGYSVYFASNDNEVMDILKHHRQMLLLVPVHEQIEKLKRVA